MRQDQDMIHYFSQPGFARLFALAKKKYESLGRIGGSVRLTQLRAEEKVALGGLLGKDVSKQASLSIQLRQLEEHLLSSRYEVDVLSLLCALYGEEVKPKSVQEQENQAAWQRFMGAYLSSAKESETRHWLQAVREGNGWGYRTFRDIFDKRQEIPVGQRSKQDPVFNVIRALDQLPIRHGDELPLPIFSAKMSGDPHFFDRDRVTGRLLYYGLLAYLGVAIKAEESASEVVSLPDNDSRKNIAAACAIRQQYRAVGIRLDALSSHVLVVDVSLDLAVSSYALTLDTIEQEHSGMHTAVMRYFMEHARHAGKVFVSENPAICVAIMDDFQQMSRYQKPSEVVTTSAPPAPLICTSGQPSVAAIALLDVLTQHDVHLYYSGDLDVKGIEMASALQKRYGSYWHPWRMTAEVVVDVLHQTKEHNSGVSFSSEELASLQRLSTSWDPQLIDLLRKERRKIYQEMMVDVLKESYHAF